jgi:hypothetical protein
MQSEELPGDASTLIYLAKADVFETAAFCVGAILAPPGVWRESVEAGERLGYPDVPRIRDAANAGFLKRVGLSPAESGLAAAIASQHRLGTGESEVLALAHPAGRALVDEGRASRVARALGIVPISSLFLPVVGFEEGRLDRTDAVGLLRRLAVVAGARAEAVFEIEKHLSGGER